MMTVAELIEVLKQLDPNVKVGVHSNSDDRDIDFIDGAEMVYSDVAILGTVDEEEAEYDRHEG